MAGQVETKGEIIIYQDKQGPEIEVSFSNETLWLSQAQIAELFQTDRTVITRHIGNIVKSGELGEKGNVQKMHIAKADRPVKFYNLDFVISVGYRVNSRRATQFRIWATQKLKAYIAQGYVINEKRLKETDELRLKELQEASQIIQKAIESKRLEGYEKELLHIIADYTSTWALLYHYDQDELPIENVSRKKVRYLDYGEVQRTVERFKKRLVAQGQAGDLFGQGNSAKFEGILRSIEQGYDGKDLYPSVEEKAAHLLYFVIKHHPFVDGNKRIGSLLFILFLIENSCMNNKKGERKINDNALTTLALLIAESDPRQKQTMIRLVVNLISK